MLNQASLNLLMSVFDEPFCQPHLRGFWEDVMVAQCLRKSDAQLLPQDTRDTEGRERFHPFTPGQHLDYHIPKGGNDWYAQYSIELKTGVDCCSPQSISFHYVQSDLMHRIDALLHECRAV